MSLATIDLYRFDLADGQTLLDLGCGEGRHTISAALEAALTAWGIDLREQDLATCASRFDDFRAQAPGHVLLAKASGFALPFADDSFDRVICSEVLEHIIDYQQVLEEIDRVLKPGGLLAVSVPRYGPEWLCWRLSDAYHEVEGGHVRIFRADELDDAVRERPYQRYAKHHAHGLHSPYWWLRCLFWSSGDSHPLVKAYHRLLVWDLMKQPRLTRALEWLLNPLIGKSVVMYYERTPETPAESATTPVLSS